MKKRLGKESVMLLVIVCAMSGFGAAYVQAMPFGERCSTLRKCADQVEALTGTHYVFSMEFADVPFAASENLELTSMNAEILFSKALNIAGYTRVPMSAKKTYSIEKLRDARDSSIPRLTARKSEPPQFPQHYDLMTMTYEVQHKGNEENMARTLRSFLKPNDRIVPSVSAGLIWVTSDAQALKKVYEMLVEADVPLHPKPKMKSPQ